MLINVTKKYRKIICTVFNQYLMHISEMYNFYSKQKTLETIIIFYKLKNIKKNEKIQANIEAAIIFGDFKSNVRNRFATVLRRRFVAWASGNWIWQF